MIINYSHHDALFKKFLGEIAVARDFFNNHLPPSLRQQCNFNTLSLCSGSFIDPNMRHHCSDMLYSVRTRRGKGYIYCLIEHQSSPQKMMAFRLMRYSLAAMQQHLDMGNKVLPVVVPLLFYHGTRKGYPYKNDWFDCFDNNALARQVYNCPFPVIDLSMMSDDEIKTHGRVAMLELVLKHIRIRDIGTLVEDLGILINHWQPSHELRKSLFSYILQTGKTLDSQLLIDKLTEQAPLFLEKEEMMTIAQQLKDEGRLEGKREGKREGKKEGKQEVARQLFMRGLDFIMIKEVTGLSDDELKRVAH
ncbi:Rpn family recombination-promoting nuclease/putative transposase [Sodalis sp. dw_96]|uniref:Rpn family recombination-promoting nuclease/putative transposase n=1 Tax=Sodalis sp. dw_96 TaxID=2719794 RepID=UPI001BD648B3|nr:Rpn family recombination-promoting nuclease/putative transposase [Sodalis sp. dw_96]